MMLPSRTLRRARPGASEKLIQSIFSTSPRVTEEISTYPIRAGAVSERIREDNTKASTEAVNAAEEIVASAGMKTETAVLEGSPKRRIVEESKAWGADLIVVGSHGRRGLTRYLLGSVSEAVAMHAHCSVEVIRDRALLDSSGA